LQVSLQAVSRLVPRQQEQRQRALVLARALQVPLPAGFQQAPQRLEQPLQERQLPELPPGLAAQLRQRAQLAQRLWLP
jgi:hypothetical protein